MTEHTQCNTTTKILWMDNAFDCCQKKLGHKGEHRSTWYKWDENSKKEMPYL